MRLLGCLLQAAGSKRVLIGRRSAAGRSNGCWRTGGL